MFMRHFAINAANFSVLNKCLLWHLFVLFNLIWRVHGCIVIRCNALESTYGELNSSDTEFGVTVNMSCSPGYRINGGQLTTTTVHCTGTGHWAPHNHVTCLRTIQLHLLLLIHDLLFLPISTIESTVGKRLITHCCVSRLACSRLSGHIELHLPDFKREINTTTTVMN